MAAQLCGGRPPGPEAAQRDADARRAGEGPGLLYALGCVLHEMLVGVPPFTGESAYELGEKHVHEPPTPVRLIRSDIPEPLARLLGRLLAKDPADRPVLPKPRGPVSVRARPPHPHALARGRCRTQSSFLTPIG